ncbi:tyrosine-type recombinase/integrase [Testudinibacter sp. TR-2022]|uniref:tyrosine-type recombinase/integrase n=1 Tax=Testudinibacter sp. TR-2022 TaxID=2585029 RepID=UPI001119FB3A|nr:site-specific integrase [Testudinibacter sp. TR-2022]TNH06506.1 site-specific integrase [Pasteurellaceae bacterium Phil11]TNH25499.1 site-specific integrase [Testudinibacter sp. TR-2022]TNH28082.1 site-specific integrase [Testudinibacter sp. TR-2022]
MPIRKNKNGIWQIDFTTPTGERIRCSSQTTEKKLAQEYHDKLKHDAWKIEKLNKKPERTVEEALIRFLEDAEHQKNLDTKIQHAEYWRVAIGHKLLSSLTSDDIYNNLPTHIRRTGRKLAPATQNRYRTSIMRALNLAKQAGWVDSIPYIQKNDEPKKRIRWITQQEASRLLESLNLDWMKEVCSFALMTGARMTEVLTMTWDKIDFARSLALVTGDIAKSGHPRALPLGREAIHFLRQKETKRISNYVFHRGKGKLITDIDREDFKRALERADIKDFRFHDLRHTWASWHVQNGTPLLVLKELGGWETIEMVQKYAHLNAGHLLTYANQVKISSNSLPDFSRSIAGNDELEEISENKKAVSY